MSINLFGEEIEIEEDEIAPEKSKKPTPFEFIGAVSETKKDIVKDDPDMINHYNAFIINRGFGYFADTVLYANELNMLPDMPAEAQYYYYYTSLRKRQRRSKWFKQEPNADIDLIRQVYGVRMEVAKEYLKILTEDNLQTLRELTDTGEISTKRKKK